MDDQGHITVVARESGLHRITFHTAAWGIAQRTLEIGGPDGVVARIESGPDDRQASVDVPLGVGGNDLTVSNLGRAAEQISQTDRRVVSVRVSEWDIRRLG